VFLYGLTRFRDLFTPRQLATLCAFADGVRASYEDMRQSGMEEKRAEAVSAYLGLTCSRLADYGSNLCRWHTGYETLMNTYARQALQMVWDFAEGILSDGQTTTRLCGRCRRPFGLLSLAISARMRWWRWQSARLRQRLGSTHFTSAFRRPIRRCSVATTERWSRRGSGSSRR
jgi:hypothetical protein